VSNYVEAFCEAQNYEGDMERGIGFAVTHQRRSQLFLNSGVD